MFLNKNNNKKLHKRHALNCDLHVNIKLNSKVYVVYLYVYA